MPTPRRPLAVHGVVRPVPSPIMLWLGPSQYFCQVYAYAFGWYTKFLPHYRIDACRNSIVIEIGWRNQKLGRASSVGLFWVAELLVGDCRCLRIASQWFYWAADKTEIVCRNTATDTVVWASPWINAHTQRLIRAPRLIGAIASTDDSETFRTPPSMNKVAIRIRGVHRNRESHWIWDYSRENPTGMGIDFEHLWEWCWEWEWVMLTV